MRLPRFASFVVFAFLAQFASAQQISTTIQRDPQAITLAQQTLAAMGGAQALLLQDSVAVGQAQIFKPDGSSTTLPITKKSKGTTMVRTELQRPEGTQVRILNNGAAAIQRADGSVQPLITNNTVAERVEHIPALSLLSEWASASTEILYVGSDSVNGQPVDVISISYTPSGVQAPALWRTMTRGHASKRPLPRRRSGFRSTRQRQPAHRNPALHCRRTRPALPVLLRARHQAVVRLFHDRQKHRGN